MFFGNNNKKEMKNLAKKPKIKIPMV